MKTYFIAGRNASASPATKYHGNMSSASLDAASGSAANVTEDTDSERGEGSEAKQDLQSRKPLLSSNINGASGSGGSPEKSVGEGSETVEEGKDAVLNHAENQAGGDSKPENGGVISQPGSGAETPQGGAMEASPITLNASIIMHHNEEPNTENQLTKFLKEDGQMDYFEKPPISQFSLRFLDREVEDKYHSQFTPDYMQPDRQVDGNDDKRNERRHSSETISTTRYNTLLDVCIAFATFILVGISCFLVFNIPIPWAVLFPIISILQVIILLAMVREAFCRNVGIILAEYIAALFHNWYRRHILGALLLCCPVIAVFTNYSCDNDGCFGENRLFFCFLLVVSLLHFCNFVQLNLWMKLLLALASGTILLVLLFICRNCPVMVDMEFFDGTTPTPYDLVDATPTMLTDLCEMNSHHYVNPEEVILVIILLLILIFVLNREYEIGFRLNYYSNYQALVDHEKMKSLQEEAEKLLHHIVPQFVTEQLRTTSKFSQNHDNVAVIFCSIVNFNDFYEEAYEGGKECIRVLHELISDFDNLLNDPKYKEVEKIKTIGSTYMAACGLRPSEKPNDVQTLVTLMDFADEMMLQIQKFNEDVLSMTIGAFNFILRIGYNHGKLTSGVIGTTKLLYDIWGDTVNVASRMDSTGMPGHIQVTEHSMKVLQPYYEFEKRGEVKVRGKGDMTTYLVVKKRPVPLSETQ
nr:adenylate cyclase type 9-like [Lytechinus pictus]XP_054755044.1 adenylate cyclase type 9-like [Lytechinus pictus]